MALRYKDFAYKQANIDILFCPLSTNLDCDCDIFPLTVSGENWLCMNGPVPEVITEKDHITISIISAHDLFERAAIAGIVVKFNPPYGAIYDPPGQHEKG